MSGDYIKRQLALLTSQGEPTEDYIEKNIFVSNIKYPILKPR